MSFSQTVRRSHFGLLVTVFLLAGCTRSDSLYCDEDTPCPDGQYCDLSGAYPASNGVGKTCIADPNSPGDGDGDGDGDGPDASMVACDDSSECPGDEPICASGVCGDCSLDSQCGDRNAAAPICLGDGSCAECGSNAQCANPTPICDADEHECRGCVDHGECASGVCDPNASACVAEAHVVHVDAVQGADSPLCGSAAGTEACATISGTDGGLSKVDGDRKYLLISAANYTESITINGLEVLLIGPGAINDPHFGFFDASALDLLGEADVTVDGMTLMASDGLLDGVGIDCESSTLRLYNTTVRDNLAGGIRADLCDVEIRRSLIDDNSSYGIDADGGELFVSRSTISRNERAGIRVSEAPFEVTNNFIVRNKGGGFVARNGSDSSIAASAQALIHNTIVKNESLGSGAGVVCETANAVQAPSNIIYDNYSSFGSPVTGLCEFRYSNVAGGMSGTGNIDEAPTFMSPMALPGNFHLTADSAGIDEADPSGMASEDVDGDRRPLGLGFDMGADERRP